MTKKDIKKEDIEKLINEGADRFQMSTILNISIATLGRYKRMYGLNKFKSSNLSFLKNIKKEDLEKLTNKGYEAPKIAELLNC